MVASPAMALWFAVLLGIVQGLTEFLPVSSTAHLRLTPALLGVADPGAAFTAVIQLGTLVAVIVYFWRDLVGMVRGLLRGPRAPEARLALFLVVGTIPIGIAGLALKKLITGDARSLWVVATALIVVGGVMLLADRRGRQQRAIGDLTFRDALVVGCAQACALIPGVSRSGSTISAALALGFRREDAARFSFLLSIPAIGAAGVFELPEALAQVGSGSAALPLIVATVVSGLVGYASIAWLLRFLRTRSFVSMVIYRVALGGVVLALLGAGVLTAL